MLFPLHRSAAHLDPSSEQDPSAAGCSYLRFTDAFSKSKQYVHVITTSSMGVAPAPPATAEAQQINKIRDLLLGQDVSGQVELLLNLLSDAAAGKELSNVLSEVIQVGLFEGGRGDLVQQNGPKTAPPHLEHAFNLSGL